MTLERFVDYSNVKKVKEQYSIELSSDSNPEWNRMIPVLERDGLRYWTNSTIPRNRTYLGLSETEISERGIHPFTVLHKDYQHPYLPNYLRMELMNQGMWKENGDERKSRLHPQDNWYRQQAIITQLDLTEAQRFQVLSYSQLESVRKAARGFSLDEVTYCLCGIVCWEDGRRTHPNMKSRDELFTQIESKLPRRSRIPKVWGRLFAALNKSRKSRV